MIFRAFSKSIGIIGSVIALRFISSSSVMACSANQGNPETAQSVYEFTVNDIKGEPVSLEKYKGHVLIIVNVASKCGYTAKHYAELNEIYDQYADTKGLRILAFPCNQFNNQEPGNAEEIQCFLKDRKVKFDLFEKVDVNGKEAHPLWQFLKKEQGGTLFDAIKWNFTKFIVDKDGKPVGRFAPNTSPKEMLKDLEKFF